MSIKTYTAFFATIETMAWISSILAHITVIFIIGAGTIFDWVLKNKPMPPVILMFDSRRQNTA